MANVLTIFAQNGPLPLKTTLNVETNAPALLMLSGSVWTQKANSTIGITLLIDGKAAGSASIFCNPTAQHTAVVTAYIPIQVSIGPHAFTLQISGAPAISDLNDFYNVCLLY